MKTTRTDYVRGQRADVTIDYRDMGAYVLGLAAAGSEPDDYHFGMDGESAELFGRWITWRDYMGNAGVRRFDSREDAANVFYRVCLPSEGDVTVVEEGSGYFIGNGVEIGLTDGGRRTYDSREDACEAVEQACEASGVYPTVWHVNHRGMWDLLDTQTGDIVCGHDLIQYVGSLEYA